MLLKQMSDSLALRLMRVASIREGSVSFERSYGDAMKIIEEIVGSFRRRYVTESKEQSR